MKNLFCFIFIFLIFSCGTEEVPQVLEKDCKCGVAENTGGSWTTTGTQMTWNYTVRNNCTNASIFVTTNAAINTSKPYCKDYQW